MFPRGLGFKWAKLQQALAFNCKEFDPLSEGWPSHLPVYRNFEGKLRISIQGFTTVQRFILHVEDLSSQESQEYWEEKSTSPPAANHVITWVTRMPLGCPIHLLHF